MVGLPVFGIFTCARMLMHVIAHRGCANTMRQSALEVDSGRKILCCNRELNPCHLAFQSDACKSPNACALFCMVWSVPLYLCCCNTNSEGHKTCLLLIDSKWMCFDLALMGFCFYFMGPLKKKIKNCTISTDASVTFMVDLFCCYLSWHAHSSAI